MHFFLIWRGCNSLRGSHSETYSNLYLASLTKENEQGHLTFNWKLKFHSVDKIKIFDTLTPIKRRLFYYAAQNGN